MTAPTARRAESERHARRRAAQGLAGADLHADLIDLLDLARHGELSGGGAYCAWERAAGFADPGTEIAG